MYEARTIMIKIIKLIIEREKLKAEGKVNEDSEKTYLAKIATRIMSTIAVLQEEHRIFKRPFIVNGMDYLE